MRLFDAFTMSLGAIVRNKLRSVLTLVGIVAERFVRNGSPRWGVALLLVPVLCAQILAHKVLVPTPDAKTWDLVATQDASLIHHLWFAPYGDELSPFHTQAVGLGPEIRPRVRKQYLGLFGYCVVVSGGLWIASVRRKDS